MDDDLNVKLVPIPFTEIAKEQGSQLMKNMVAIGASARLVNLQLGPFWDMIHRMFIRKGKETVESNNQALKQGYDAMGEEMPAVAGDFEMKAPHDEERLFLIGNDAIS